MSVVSSTNSSPRDESCHINSEASDLDKPPPNKKCRITPANEYTEADLLPPELLGTILPIPPAPQPETPESVQKLLAPYKSKLIAAHSSRQNHQPRISVLKHKKHKPKTNVTIPARNTNQSQSLSRATSESTNNGYITVYDIPDSCWSLIFHFCTVHDLVFHIASSNKFFQTLVIDTSTWIHRRVVLPSKIYNPSLKQKVQNTLENIFLNWTSLKQLDIIIAPNTSADRLTVMWRLLCTPQPKVEILRVGNSIGLPGGDLCAVNENAFKYLKMIQDIEVLDFSFNMFGVSYDCIIDFFAGQAGQIYTPPPKPKKSYMYQWRKKNKEKEREKLKSAENDKGETNDTNTNTNVQKTETDSNSNIVRDTSTNTHSEISLEPLVQSGEQISAVNAEIEVFNDDSITPLPEVIDLLTPPYISPNECSGDMDIKHFEETGAVILQKQSILGKRTRDNSEEGLTETSNNKRSTKHEMDSEGESNRTWNNNLKSPQFSPKYFRHRKRRRTSDYSQTQSVESDAIIWPNPSPDTNNNSKQEISLTPPVRVNSKKLRKRRHNRYRSSLSAIGPKRHRMRRKPIMGSPLSFSRRKKRSNIFQRRIGIHAKDRLHRNKNVNTTPKNVNTNNTNQNHKSESINSVKIIKKEMIIPKEFGNLLSCTPSPITSPILDQNTFNHSVYGKKRRKTILSNIDPSLMSTLKDLNNDELELNLSLTLNIDSIDIGLNDTEQSTVNAYENDNDHYYESYRNHLSTDYSHIDRKRNAMKDLGRHSKLRRIYFREFCMKSFPDVAYGYLNTQSLECLSLYTGDTSSLIAFIDKCGRYPAIKKIEIDGTSPFRWRCAPLCEALAKCINLCSVQLPSVVDAVDIIAFDSFVNAAVNLSEIGLVTGDRQLFKPIHDVIHKHGFKMDINPSGLRFIFARRKNKPKLRETYYANKAKFLQRKRANTY